MIRAVGWAEGDTMCSIKLLQSCKVDRNCFPFIMSTSLVSPNQFLFYLFIFFKKALFKLYIYSGVDQQITTQYTPTSGGL